MSDVHVRDFMTHSPHCLPDTYTLSGAYEWLLGEGIRGAPVVDEGGELVGVVSNSDLLAALAPVLDPQGEVDADTLQELKDLPLTALIERRPVICSPDMPLDEACRLMLRHRVRRVVVQDGAEVVGVLSATDLVYAYATSRE